MKSLTNEHYQKYNYEKISHTLSPIKNEKVKRKEEYFHIKRSKVTNKRNLPELLPEHLLKENIRRGC